MYIFEGRSPTETFCPYSEGATYKEGYEQRHLIDYERSQKGYLQTR